MKTLFEEERGFTQAAAIFDLTTTGLPNLLLDLASRRSLLLCWALLFRSAFPLGLYFLISPTDWPGLCDFTHSDSKKCLGSDEFISCCLSAPLLQASF